ALGDTAQGAWQQVKELSTWFGSLFQRDDLTRQHEMMLEDSAYSTTRKIIEAFKAVNSAMFQAGMDMIQSVIDGVTAKAGELLAWFADLPAKIRAAVGRIDLSGLISWGNLNPFGGGEETPAQKTAVDGARAKGGPVRAGRTYLVGERGAELFSPGASGMISPHDAYRAAAAGASATSTTATAREVHVHVNVPAITVSGVQDPRTAAQMTVAELGGAIKAAVEAADTD
ncbi:MAG: hypothetical protein KJ065_28530, partial [Anaerolineae bacterium]|nr:hypothetical protein [Anaerolineae bacterium]